MAMPQKASATMNAATPVRLMSRVSCPRLGSVVLSGPPCGFIGLGGCMFRLQKLFHLRIVPDQYRPRLQVANKEEDPESPDRERRRQIHPIEGDLMLLRDEVRFHHPVEI